MKPDKTMMHGSNYSGENPTGWIVTEKFDGFFARWTGKTLLTREGIDYNAPAWFTEKLTYLAMDCELFAGYGNRETLNSAPRWKDKNRWRSVELIAFDVPDESGYLIRHGCIHNTLRPSRYIRLVETSICTGKPGLIESLSVITRKGGEGLVIRQPEAPYVIGRVKTMLKVKPEFLNQ